MVSSSKSVKNLKSLSQNSNVIGSYLARDNFFLVTGFIMFKTTFCTNKNSKIDNDIFVKIKDFLKKEEKKTQLKKFNFKKEVKFDLIRLGNLNFDLIIYKINMSNNYLKNKEIKNKKEKYFDFSYFTVKLTNEKIEYNILYINFIKERNIIYILFTILQNKVVEISIIYIFESKILKYFIFYEIYIQNFFDFIYRIQNEIKVFELYLYDVDCIIPKAIIQSINICLVRQINDKYNIKYI